MKKEAVSLRKSKRHYIGGLGKEEKEGRNEITLHSEIFLSKLKFPIFDLS